MKLSGGIEVNMKKGIGLILVLCMMMALGVCAQADQEEGAGRQTATDTFQVEGKEAVVAVDLTGGWSVEFASQSIYLYDGANDGERPEIAFGYVIDQQEYDENIAEYSSYDSFVEDADGVKFSEEDGGSNKYLFAVGNGLYFMIAADQDADAEAVYARFDVKPGLALDVTTEKEDLIEEPLVGIWEYTDEENGIGAVYDLKGDGTGTYTMTVGDEEVTYELKYEVEDSHLLVTYVNNDTFTDDDVFYNEFRFEDDGTLIIKDSFDEEMTFIKKEGG